MDRTGWHRVAVEINSSCWSPDVWFFLGGGGATRYHRIFFSLRVLQLWPQTTHPHLLH